MRDLLRGRLGVHSAGSRAAARRVSSSLRGDKAVGCKPTTSKARLCVDCGVSMTGFTVTREQAFADRVLLTLTAPCAPRMRSTLSPEGARRLR